MAVELRNWVEGQLHVDLPVVQLMRSPGLSQLIKTLCDQFAQNDTGNSQHAVAQQPTVAKLEDSPERLLANIGHLSSDEVDQMLATLLEEESGAAGDSTD